MITTIKNRIGASETEHETNKKEHTAKGIVNLWGGLSEEAHEWIVEECSAFGSEDLTLLLKRDEPLQRNPFDAADHGAAAWGGRDERGIRKQLRHTFGRNAEIFSVLAVDGTGMTAMKAARPFKELSLDSMTNFVVASPNPPEHERVCRAVNLSTIDPRKHSHVFLTKADRDEHAAYPHELAQLVLSFRWIDSTNTFSRAAAYRELEPNGIKQTRNAISDALTDMRLHFGSRPHELFGFDPGEYLTNPDAVDIWREDRFQAFVRVPRRRFDGTAVTEGLGSQLIDVSAATAPVDSVHVILTRQLSSEFMTRVRTDHLRWLHSNAESVDHWTEVVEDEFGWGVDPQEKLEWLTRTEMGVNHPTVRAVFEEDSDGDGESVHDAGGEHDGEW
jgi:hypothetical protein